MMTTTITAFMAARAQRNILKAAATEARSLTTAARRRAARSTNLWNATFRGENVIEAGTNPFKTTPVVAPVVALIPIDEAAITAHRNSDAHAIVPAVALVSLNSSAPAAVAIDSRDKMRARAAEVDPQLAIVFGALSIETRITAEPLPITSAMRAFPMSVDSINEDTLRVLVSEFMR